MIISNIGKFRPEIEKEIEDRGYHILNQSLPSNSYPNKFPKFKKLDEIKIGKIYTIRLFIRITNSRYPTIDSGLVDIKITRKTKDNYIGEILTLLPDSFPLTKGQSINLKKEEILYEQINYN
ncbi:MAG: hypothetical protein V1779_10845 [bacterium]